MCGTCGCGDGARIDVLLPEGQPAGDHVHPHSHSHDDAHPHDHAHPHSHSLEDAHPHDGGRSRRRIAVETDLLARNDEVAAANRVHLAHHGTLALNLVSSPGSGKTSLLVKTIELLRDQCPVAVIEGDQETTNDAERIRATGIPAVQITTGRGCHLDAPMVARAIDSLELPYGSILFIENVGNLVCPSAFDLGEAHKVVVFSVTEGEDKPLKYPDMFRAADLLLLNKIDLVPHLDVDVELAESYARQVNPRIQIIRASARTGEGLADWVDWIHRHTTVTNPSPAEGD